MALRHRYKARSWHWMRRELPFWNPSLGTFGRVFDEMAETHRMSVENVMRSLLIDSASFEPGYGSGLGKSIFTWKPIIIEPKRPKEFNHIWFDECAELRFEGMVLPITDLKFEL